MKIKRPETITESRFFTVVSISDECEVVMTCGYDTNGKLTPVEVGKADIGIPMGDLVEFDFKILTETLSNIKKAVRAKMDSVKIFEFIVQTLCINCAHDNTGKISVANLYVQPIYAEFLNLVIDYRAGKKPDYKAVEADIEKCKVIAKSFKHLCETSLNPELHSDPMLHYLKEDSKLKPATSYKGKTELFDLQYEGYETAGEFFIPDTIEDFFGYCASKILTTNMKFIKCHYCGKYFAYTTNGKPKYCSRIVYERQLPCNEIGRSLRYTEDIKASEAKTIYRKYYRKVNYHVNTGNLDRATFEKWAVKARKLRDKTEGGKMALEDYENWLKNDLPI